MLPRQLLRHLDGIPNTLTRSEDLINLLQTPARRLRVEEIHHGKARRVDGGVDDEVLVPDRRKRNRCNLHHEEIEQPAHCRADAADRRTQVHGRDFAGVEEGDAEEAEDIDEIVEVEEEDRRFQATWIVGLGSQPRERDLAERHGGRGAEHEGAAAEAVDGVAADDAAEDDDELRRSGEDVGDVEGVAEI